MGARQGQRVEEGKPSSSDKGLGPQPLLFHNLNPGANDAAAEASPHAWLHVTMQVEEGEMRNCTLGLQWLVPPTM